MYIYAYIHPCPTLRNLAQLKESLRQIDMEYDSCHEMWANGEVSNFDAAYHPYF